MVHQWGFVQQAGFQAQRPFCQRTRCRDKHLYKASNFGATESLSRINRISSFLFAFLKKRSSLKRFFRSPCRSSMPLLSVASRQGPGPSALLLDRNLFC